MLSVYIFIFMKLWVSDNFSNCIEVFFFLSLPCIGGYQNITGEYTRLQPPPLGNANQLFSPETLFLFMMFTFINRENPVSAILGVCVIGYVCNIDI